MDDERAFETGAGAREKEQEPQQLQEVSSSTTTTTMKFSFSSSKSKFSASRPPQFPKVGGKRRSDEGGGADKKVEFVTGLDAQGLMGEDPKRLSGAKVIPKMENSWRPEKRMKNIVMETDVMTSTQDERFEEETVVGASTPSVQYCLIEGFKKVVETSSTVTTKPKGNNMVQETTIATRLERTTEQKTSALTFAQLEEERFRHDLAALPDVPDLDAHDEMPVEDFGEAMLRGMSWEKGKPVGLNSKVAVLPVEHVRSGRTGLGAQPVLKELNNSRPIKPGESRLPAPDLVASVGVDGRVRNVVSLDEKLVERSRKGVVKGKLMSIISGRHLGLRGEVLDSHKSDRILMKLVKSGEKVLVSAADSADIGSLEEEKVLKQIRQLQIRTHQDRDDSGAVRGRKGSYNYKEYERSRGEGNGGSAMSDAIGASTEGRYKDAWLTSQIRVRIISKTLNGGRFHLKMGRIVDVVTPKEFDILLDESGEILQQVRQDQLELALPKRGGRIMVVGGRYRGHVGKLVKGDSEGEVGLVQMEESFEMRTLDLDFLAEFVGEASEKDD